VKFTEETVTRLCLKVPGHMLRYIALRSSIYLLIYLLTCVFMCLFDVSTKSSFDG